MAFNLLHVPYVSIPVACSPCRWRSKQHELYRGIGGVDLIMLRVAFNILQIVFWMGVAGYLHYKKWYWSL